MWVDELRAAVGTATAWRRLAADLPPPVRVAGLAYLPLVGGAVGLAAAAADRVGALAAPLAGVLLAVAALEALAGRRLEVAGGLAALVKVGALAVLPASGHPVALVLAAALARWAVVVQCYGGSPAAGADASPLVGRARFREFGAASVTAIGGALVGLDALGLTAVLGAALSTVGLRLVAYRRGGGLSAAWLARTETAVEAVVLGVLAALVAALQPGP
jgi:hypothetical protein